MIHLMLDAAGEQLCALDDDLLAMTVQAPYLYTLCAPHIPCEPGNAEAALRSEHLALTFDNLRIDQFDEPVIVSHIHHDHPLRDSDLRSRQPDAFGIVHRIGHIIEQLD